MRDTCRRNVDAGHIGVDQQQCGNGVRRERRGVHEGGCLEAGNHACDCCAAGKSCNVGTVGPPLM